MTTTAYSARGAETDAALAAPARSFLVQVTAAAAAAAAAGAAHSQSSHWAFFFVLAAGAMVAQLGATHIRGNQVFHTGLAFTVAGALVLPPRALILLCLVQHLPDWLRHRYPWYIQTFNIANYALSALVAWATYAVAVAIADDPSPPVRMAAALAAAGAFVAVNHLLLARMLRLARGHERGATGLFGLDGILIDATLAAIGVGLAVALDEYPAAVAAIAFPLVLIQRASIIPVLQAQATRDAKTGLLNMHGFREAASAELARAARFDRPLALILADVDDLRVINNRYGHLAGDAALAAVSDAIRAATRDYDLCARFGGDEFVILLPETDATDADSVAGRITAQLTEQPVATRDGGFRVDLSCGVATRSAGTSTLDDLLRAADGAMYAAKRD